MSAEKKYNIYDAEVCYQNKRIAYVSCNYVNEEIVIRSLFVHQKYKGKGYGEVLLAKVMDFAVEQDAVRIVSYCGPEPFCEDGQVPLDQEIAWYEAHGFVHDHDVMGYIPCMIKTLREVVAAL